MTDTDKPAFLQAFARLCVALREKEPDAVAIRVYFDTLKDIDVELVVAAGERLLHTTWFPEASEWASAARKIEADRIDSLRARLRKLKTPLCDLCQDTGWARDDASDRVSKCECARLRRLEVLGRRPWPELPESTSDTVEAGR
jgi:hypothetical protein